MRAALFLFASIVVMNTGVAIAAGDTTRGETIATQGNGAGALACVTCHGPNGMGVGNSFPALSGQHASYLKAQLIAWRDGSRDNDPNQLMKGIAER